MRAVLGCLVGTFLGVGAAQAEPTCPVTRAQVRVEDTGFRYGGVVELSRPDLVGQYFRIRRYTVRRKEYFSKPIGAMKLLGYEAYELAGAAGTFEAMRDHVDGVPAVTPMSWASGSKDAVVRIAWGGGSPERVKVGQDLDYFLSGPLSALTLRVIACH